MNFSSASLIFLLAAAPALAADSAPPDPGSKMAPAALRFDKMPLGNVVRVLSARFGVPVTITAKATAPISGDFSSLDLDHALGEAAKQAGLVVQPRGADPKAARILSPPEAKPPGPSPAEVKAVLEAADKRRAELLRQRAVLLDQAARLDH